MKENKQKRLLLFVYERTVWLFQRDSLIIIYYGFRHIFQKARITSQLHHVSADFFIEKSCLTNFDFML